MIDAYLDAVMDAAAAYARRSAIIGKLQIAVDELRGRVASLTRKLEHASTIAKSESDVVDFQRRRNA